jgi:hypothetical protein
MADSDATPLPFDVAQQASYDFFYQYLHDEVERLRFNDRADPIELELHATGQKPDFVGRKRFGHRWLRAEAREDIDEEGRKILKISIHRED